MQADTFRLLVFGAIMRTTRAAIAIATASFLFLDLLPGAIAQDTYPTRPIRIIVPYPPGGINDFAARGVSKDLSVALKTSVIIDNRGGAGGIVGTKLAAMASADGYTLVVASEGALAVNQNLYRKPPYDVMRDFAAVVHIANTAYVVVVNPSLPVRSLTQLIAFAKAAPKPLSYGSTGLASGTYLSTELFASMAGIQLVHVPYKGAGPAITDLIGSHISMMVATMPSAMQQVHSGKLRALAVGSARRSPSLPEVPTVAEAGLPGYTSVSFSGMCAPVGTPRAIVARLAREVNEILQTSAAKAYFHSLGAEPVGGTPAEFAAFLGSELKKWKRVIELAGVPMTE